MTKKGGAAMRQYSGALYLEGFPSRDPAKLQERMKEVRTVWQELLVKLGVPLLEIEREYWRAMFHNACFLKCEESVCKVAFDNCESAGYMYGIQRSRVYSTLCPRLTMSGRYEEAENYARIALEHSQRDIEEYPDLFGPDVLLLPKRLLDDIAERRS